MTETRDLLELELRPLPTSLDGKLLSDDALLGKTLHDLYPTELTPPSERGWALLAPLACEEASRRRRRYLAGRLAVAMGPQRLMAYAALLLVLVGVAMVAAYSLKVTPPQVPVIAALHATIDGTAAAPRRAQLLNGALIELRGEAAVDQSSPKMAELDLHSGMVHSSVPKLPPGHSFVVMTPHAAVTVHGTRFTVEQAPSGDTTVSVEEGLVSVRPLDGHRPEVFVRPGESVTVPPFSVYFAGLQAEVNHAAQTEEVDDCKQMQTVAANYIAAAPPTTDVSVAHYLLGVCAKRRGDLADAINQFEVAAQISTSRDRADNALARAAQLRADRNPKDGVKAWERYLKRFPEGLHTDNAKQFLGEASEGSSGP